MPALTRAAVAVVAIGALSLAQTSFAQVRVTEVAPWSSGASAVGQDWFELTNIGASTVDLTGWSMDDDSFTAGGGMLAGVTLLAAGESAVFIDGDGSAAATFVANWFGAAAPAGLQIGWYDGPGLSTGGDAVAIYDAGAVLQTSVSFGGSTNGVTFDNAAGLDGVIGQLAVAGVDGAFVAPSGEIGSPGVITAVPEPATIGLWLAGLGLVGWCTRGRDGRGQGPGQRSVA